MRDEREERERRKKGVITNGEDVIGRKYFITSCL